MSSAKACDTDQGRFYNKEGVRRLPRTFLHADSLAENFLTGRLLVMTKLRDRVALVTGAGRGIGRAIALALAREGARVAVTARTGPELEEVFGTIRSHGGQGLLVVADLTDRAAIPRVVQEVTAALGPVEILVNNAGIGSSANPKPVVEFNDDFWELTLRLNLTVPYLLSKAVLPGMLARRWGRIVNVASINGKIGSLHGAA